MRALRRGRRIPPSAQTGQWDSWFLLVCDGGNRGFRDLDTGDKLARDHAEENQKPDLPAGRQLVELLLQLSVRDVFGHCRVIFSSLKRPARSRCTRNRTPTRPACSHAFVPSRFVISSLYGFAFGLGGGGGS